MINIFSELIKRNPHLEDVVPCMKKAYELLIEAYKNGGKLLVCGNGGSCADADHIVGELMKGFLLPRPLNDALQARLSDLGGGDLAKKLQTPLRAINLSSMPALSTAFANDVDPNYIYSQLTLGYTDPQDVFLGISTSGNAKNIHCAAIVAKAAGAKLIGLTGETGGLMKNSGLYDVLICAPESVTYLIQEAHISIYHALCIAVEDTFFG